MSCLKYHPFLPLFFKIRQLSLAIFLSSALVLTSHAQTHGAALDNLMQSYYTNGYLNGAVLVAKGDSMIYQAAFGYANMEWKIKNTVDTKFKIGSMTKPITATLVLKLMEENILSEQGKVSDYLDYYPNAIGELVTIGQLLNHTSGIPNYTFHKDLEIFNKHYTPVDSFVLKYCVGRLMSQPGRRFAYNNSGYYLLGAIVEAVTGLSYNEALQKYVFRPLGMQDSGYFGSHELIEHSASGYIHTLTGFASAPYSDMSIPYATAGITSTLGDLHKWVRSFTSYQLLSKETVDKTNQEHFNLRPGLGYANGWFIEKRNINGHDVTIASHGGEIDGFNSLVMRVPEDDLSIIILNNTGKTQIFEMVLNILNVIYDLEVVPPPDHLTQWLGRNLTEKGIEATLAAIEQDSTLAARISGSEEVLGTWARYLMRLHRNDEALLLMAFVTARFPESAAAFHLLGDILLNSGARQQAIQSFEKAKALDPGDPRIQIKLQSLQR